MYLATKQRSVRNWMPAHRTYLQASMTTISFGFEVSGEAVEVRLQWSASEVDKCSLLFEPILPEKTRGRWGQGITPAMM